MRVGRLLVVLGSPLVFGAGWLAGTRDAPPLPMAETAPPPPIASVCVDQAAMDANANLVAQLHEARAQLRQVHATAKELEAKTVEVEDRAPATFVTRPDEWSRMGKDGMLRLQTPCKSYDASPRIRVIGANVSRMSATGRSTSMAPFRLAAIGLVAEELPALEQAYARAHAQTWKRMRAICEKSDAYREAIAEHRPESDHERIETCRSALLPTRSERRPAMQRVAELLAANAGADRATTDEDRVLLTATQSSADLWSELDKTFGREKAKRVAESGLVCLDETVYDVRLPKEDDGPS